MLRVFGFKDSGLCAFLGSRSEALHLLEARGPGNLSDFSLGAVVAFVGIPHLCTPAPSNKTTASESRELSQGDVSHCDAPPQLVLGLVRYGLLHYA